MADASAGTFNESSLAQLVEIMAPLMGLTIAPEYRSGVVANLERSMTIAQLVMEFPLPDEIEVAPVFQP